MKLKDFLVGAVCGIAAGALTATVISKKSFISSEEVLHRTKKLLNGKGKIIGSWIMTQPEIVEKNSLTYKAYRGGITCLESEHPINYEFLADARTGTVLELDKQG